MMTTVGDALAAEAAQRPAEPARFATGLLGPAAVLVALLSAFATFVVLAGLTPINPTHDVVVTLLGVNALAVLLLLGIIGREVWHILQARRRGKAAARLHVQIVALFSIIAALPAILLLALSLLAGCSGSTPGVWSPSSCRKKTSDKRSGTG